MVLAWAALGFEARAMQQHVDTAFQPSVTIPTYVVGTGPLVLVDEAHNNARALDSAYRPFAEVLRQDGYRTDALREPPSARALQHASVLVIINPLHDANVDNWTLPTPSAFSTAEIAAIRAWVEDGGSLLLVGDHMPFAGAAAALAEALGFEFMNGFAIDTSAWEPLVFRRGDRSLASHPITEGRGGAERVDSVATFWGLAFRPLDPGATPLMTLGRGVISYNPLEAWRFNPDTPSPPVDGWLQGAARGLGAGRVVVLGEAGMLSAHVSGPNRVPVGMNAPVASQNQQFVLNVMHWLSRGLPLGR